MVNAASGTSSIIKEAAPIGSHIIETAKDYFKKLIPYLKVLFNWIFSVKDDVFSSEEKYVNPLSLILKLLFIIFFVGAAIIFSINIFRLFF